MTGIGQERREETGGWLIFFSVTISNDLSDCSFQVLNFSFKFCSLSNRFQKIRRSRVWSNGAKKEDVSPRKILSTNFQKHLLVEWVYFCFTLTVFLLQFSQKQVVLSTSKNTYEWVCIKEWQRGAQWWEGKNELNYICFPFRFMWFLI